MGVRHSVHGHEHRHGHGRPTYAARRGRQLVAVHPEGRTRQQIELLPLPAGLTSTLLQRCLPGAAAADKWAGPLNAVCQRYGINQTLRRMAAFLGQVGYESADFKHLEENLRYNDPSRINEKFRAIKTDEEAKAYANNP